MKFTKALALAAAAAGFIAISAPAMADDAPAPSDAPTPDFTFTGNINLTNNYEFRGFTQTNDDFAVQGGFDLSHKSGLYIGTWASNVEFKDGAGPGANSSSIEIDLYGGYKGKIGNSIFSYDVGGIWYTYQGAPHGSHYDYWEFYGKLTADFGFVQVGSGFVYSPNFFAATGDAINIPLNVTIPIPLHSDLFALSVSGQVSYNKYTQHSLWDGIHDDYVNWNVGATVAITGWFNVDLRYHDTNLDKAFCQGLCDGRFTVMFSRTL